MADPGKVDAPSDAADPPTLLDAAGPAVVAAVPRTRGTLQLESKLTPHETLKPKGGVHGTAHPVHPAFKLKGAEEDVDLSLPSLSEDQVIIAANHSSSVAVQEDTELFPLLPIVVALVIDEAVNDGGVRHAVGEVLEPVTTPLLGFIMEVLDPALALLFETIGQAIYDALNLDLVDEIALRIINGGMADMTYVIETMLGRFFDDIKNAFDSVAGFITTIRNGLDAIGALTSIEQYVAPADRSKTLAVINDEPIKITDGKGNTGYLSAHERNLIQSTGGLEDLMNVLKGSSIISMMQRLKTLIEELQNSLGSPSSSNCMDSIKTELEQIFRGAQSAFQSFLSKVGGLGSIQFLVTGEAAVIGGVGLEAGISIDVRQILHFLSHNFQWDPSFTQIVSFHVGYAVDFGVQGGGDLGFCVAYHTSRVTGVRYLFGLAHVHN